MTQAQARRGLLIYFAVLVAGSGTWEWLLIRAGDSIRNHIGLVLLLMWTPAIASVVARLALREGFGDVSFRFGGRVGGRMALLNWLFPLAVGSLAYGVAWASGLARFKTPEVPVFSITTPAAAIVAIAAIRLTIGVPIAAIAAAGEEIGWRGYMLTRLVAAGVPRPVLVSGLIWAAWHMPMILGGVYASSNLPLASAGLFLVSIVGLSFVLARGRLESGSVWPAIVGHSAWNVTIQGIFDFSTVPDPDAVWVGESGVIVALATLLVAFLVRSPKPAVAPEGAAP